MYMYTTYTYNAHTCYTSCVYHAESYCSVHSLSSFEVLICEKQERSIGICTSHNHMVHELIMIN